jgi:hypothetical protein
MGKYCNLLVELYLRIKEKRKESMGIRKLAYKKIKELPEWEGSEDC